MSQERRQQQRRQRRLERQEQRRAGRTPGTQAALGKVEFTGVMGWMQRNTRWLFLGGIIVMVVSLGGGTLFSANGGATPAATPTPAVTATATPTASATASLTPTPDPSIKRTYPAAPAMAIDPSHTYEAVIHLKSGDVRVQLLPKDAPQYVNNFVFLARNRFFDGLTFHRVLPGFVAQGGDPQGNGFGGPGYVLPAERNALKFDAGVLSMASSAAGVSGSQFFITLAPTPQLQDQFIVFGRVTQGMNLIQGLTPRDPSKPNQPAADII